MAILKIARMGHPVLITAAEAVADPGAPEVRRLVADLLETMADANGAGLAAPQVHVPWRLFVFHVPAARSSGAEDDPVSGPMVLINPTIEVIDATPELGWEGCLSIPGLRAVVPRASKIRYAGVDCDGNPVTAEVSGFHARVVQHEYDHLDGTLYTMRVTDFRLFAFEDELNKWSKPQA
jgi:peptide deformylase